MGKKYDRVGGGSFGVYKERKSGFGEIVGGIFVLLIILFIIGAVFGG